ncbi:hypothetical protein [Microbispora bryophytorum]|uniref:hypothetical protein n=1 Tax=Microbispora bryophytorum TaxID=1460882 RepID=UPI003718B24A
MSLLRRERGDLSRQPIFDAIRRRYPELTREQCDVLAEEVIKKIAQAIREGKNLGTFAQLPNGDIEISMISVIDNFIDRAIAAK